MFIPFTYLNSYHSHLSSCRLQCFVSDHCNKAPSKLTQHLGLPHKCETECKRATREVKIERRGLIGKENMHGNTIMWYEWREGSQTECGMRRGLSNTMGCVWGRDLKHKIRVRDSCPHIFHVHTYFRMHLGSWPSMALQSHLQRGLTPTWIMTWITGRRIIEVTWWVTRQWVWDITRSTQ